MKKILFPTAYSSLSKGAFRYAQKLAQYFEASITLVHIYDNQTVVIGPDQELMYDLDQFDIRKREELQWEEETRKLKSFAAGLTAKQFQDIPLDFIATEGKVIQELKAIQKENNYDLIVMGMRRHSIVGRLFGNTSYKMIEEVDCPILLIPPGAYFINIDKIVYSTTLKFGNRKSVNALLDWCQAFEASLHTLHLHQDDNEEEAAKNMADLSEHYQEEEKLGIMTFQVKKGNIADIMDWYVEFQGAVLLAVHWRKQGILNEILEGNLTKTLVEKTRSPLLVLKS